MNKLLGVLNWITVCSLWSTVTVSALDNGLARTPPMGWMSQQRFGCNVDCITYPDDCISERLVKSTADAMVYNGFRTEGYSYLILDDCWMDSKRDSSGRLQADRTRFPSGIQNVISYVHSKGLKFGLYVDLGTKTCGGFPGSKGNLSLDSMTLASWQVDLVKAGACGLTSVQACNTDYVDFGRLLNATGRPMVYVCEWPQSVKKLGGQVVLADVVKTCNQFRTYNAMQDSWLDLADVFRYYSTTNRQLSSFSGPGSFNDPDQLVIGDFGLSYDQQRFQMAMWSLMSAPLFVSADLRNIDYDSKQILLNDLAISIDQDGNGSLGFEILVQGQLHIWRKPIKSNGSWVVAFFYTNIAGGPSRVSVVLSDLGVTQAAVYSVMEVFSRKSYGKMKPWYTLNCEVNPNGVMMFQFLADASLE